MLEILRGWVAEHVGAREFGVDGPSRDPRERKGEQPERGLHHAGARTVDRDHALPRDQAAKRATGGAPAGDVVGGRDAQEHGQAPPPAYEAGERKAESDVDGGRPDAVLRRRRHTWRGFAPAYVQEEQPDEKLMDRQLAEGIDRQRQSPAVPVNRCRDPASLVFDSKRSARLPRRETALDGPLDGRSGHGGPTEAQQLEWTEVERASAGPHKPQRQALDVVKVAVAELFAGELLRDGHRVLRGDLPVLAIHPRHPLQPPFTHNIIRLPPP